MTTLTIPDALVARCAERARALHPGGEEALGRAITEVSRIYTRSRQDIGGFGGARWAIAARLAFFMPRDLLKIGGPLAALSRMGAFPGRQGAPLRVLDLGAGLGGSCLGVAAYAAQTGAAKSLRVVAVDHDKSALDELTRLAADAPALGLVPVEVEARAVDLASPEAWRGGPFDLVVLGLALNEEQPDPAAEAALLRDLCALLAPGGALIVLEPALRDTTRALQAARDLIAAEGPPYVAYPCPHAAPCPMLPSKRDWCHQELSIALPPPLARLASLSGLRDERLTYASLVLRNEPGHALASTPYGHSLRLVSAPLFSKGKVEAIGCTQEGRLTRIMRLDRHRADDNAPLVEAVRGEGLGLDGLPEGPIGDRLRVDERVRVTRIPEAADLAARPADE